MPDTPDTPKYFMRAPSRFEQLAIAVPLAIGLAGCGGSTNGTNSVPIAEASPGNNPATEPQLPVNEGILESAHVSVYLPTWLLDERCNELAADLPASKASRYIISFGIPNPDGSIELPAISGSCVRMIKKLGEASQFSLAIGGWGGNENVHQKILDNFGEASKTPEVFADGMIAASEEISTVIGKPLSGIDLDWEYPNVDQAADVIRLVAALKAKMPDGHISMAVPASGYKIPVRPLVPNVDAFHVMTYDHAGPWLNKAGDIAPATWTMDKVDEWVNNLGEESKVVVGYPAYGYQYPGAKKSGDSYELTPNAHVLYRDIPKTAIVDKTGIENPSYAMLSGAWASIVTPHDIAETQSLLRTKYPNLGGSMIWELQGMVAEHFDALKR